MRVIFWGFSHTLNGKAEPLLSQFARHAPVSAPFTPDAPARAAAQGATAQTETAPAAAEDNTAVPTPAASHTPVTPASEVRP